MVDTNVYKLTVFDKNGSEVYSEIVMEYPDDPMLEKGQWFDICRLPLSKSEVDDHEFVWEDDDWLAEYMLNELELLGENL